uniref:F-box domain-containing protein n=1 Tax=Mycena chlorophos TaxID=658473 RepID=A0ABQ0LG05_MYCCL|nr:predicted protein [Mycena chlorophos]
MASAKSTSARPNYNVSSTSLAFSCVCMSWRRLVNGDYERTQTLLSRLVDTAGVYEIIRRAPAFWPWPNPD